MAHPIHARGFQRSSVLVAVLSGLLMAIIAPGVADASSQSFYSLNGNPQQGMLMSLTPNPGVVTPTSEENAKSLVGVVAPPDETAFDQQSGQISVRTDGVANALVSTLGGNIIVGDRIGPSSLIGIGAKINGSGWIAGTAQGSLDATTRGALKTTINDAHGVKHTVYVASVPLVVKVTYYNSPAADQNSWVPSSIQSAANALAHKHVSITALILSFLLIIIGVILAGMVINSAIRGGMLAIARQPLTKALVQHKVLQSFGMAVLILIVVTVGAFLLLRIL